MSESWPTLAVDRLQAPLQAGIFDWDPHGAYKTEETYPLILQSSLKLGKGEIIQLCPRLLLKAANILDCEIPPPTQVIIPDGVFPEVYYDVQKKRGIRVLGQSLDPLNILVEETLISKRAPDTERLREACKIPLLNGTLVHSALLRLLVMKEFCCENTAVIESMYADPTFQTEARRFRPKTINLFGDIFRLRKDLGLPVPRYPQKPLIIQTNRWDEYVAWAATPEYSKRLRQVMVDRFLGRAWEYFIEAITKGDAEKADRTHELGSLAVDVNGYEPTQAALLAKGLGTLYSGTLDNMRPIFTAAEGLWGSSGAYIGALREMALQYRHTTPAAISGVDAATPAA